jgi:hypothetical protein
VVGVCDRGGAAFCVCVRGAFHFLELEGRGFHHQVMVANLLSCRASFSHIHSSIPPAAIANKRNRYDIFKFNPWRAPGKAPVFDSCGMAGGRWTEAFNAAAYNTTKFAKMGDLGSVVLPKRPTGTVWTRGGEARTRWQMTANHGGGYIFRLCPADQPLTEECFMKTVLTWATPTHVLRFANASDDMVINATDVTEGGGIGWRLNPFPNVRSDPCDYNVTLHDGPGHHCAWNHCPGCGPPL